MREETLIIDHTVKQTDYDACKNGMTEREAMEAVEALELLLRHNRWRRGDDSIEMANPTAIGLAIDVACRVLADYIHVKEKTNDKDN